MFTPCSVMRRLLNSGHARQLVFAHIGIIALDVRRATQSPANAEANAKFYKCQLHPVKMRELRATWRWAQRAPNRQRLAAMAFGIVLWPEYHLLRKQEWSLTSEMEREGGGQRLAAHHGQQQLHLAP
jgi:hypothetical protein